MAGSLSTPLEVYALALVPAVIWGFTPILDKRGMSLDGRPMQASLVVVGVSVTLYAAAVLVTEGADAFADTAPEMVLLFMFAGATGTALGRLAIFAGTHRVGASIATAAVSARPLFAAAFGLGILGESISIETVVGIVVLVCGLVVLVLARGGDLAGWSTADLCYPLGAGGLFAFGNALRRFGLQTGGTSPIEAIALNEIGALLVFGVYAAFRGRSAFRSAEPRSYLYFAGSGALTAVALFGLFTALSLPGGRVAIVESLTATAPLFTTVFAFVFLRDLERVTRGVVVGALLIVVGAALVTLGPGSLGV